MPITTIAIEPDGERAAGAACGGARAAIRACPPWPPAGCRARCRSPCWPARYGSLPASHSLGWPGAAVFGYGLACRWLSTVGPFAGAEDGPPSLFGPCGVATMMNRCQVPLASPSERSEAMLRNEQREVVAGRLRRREEAAASGRAAPSSRSGALMPRGTSGSAANSPTDSSSDPSRRLNGGLRRSDGVPISSASARSGAAVTQRLARPAAARGTAPPCWPGTAAAAGTARSPRRASPAPRRSTPG